MRQRDRRGRRGMRRRRAVLHVVQVPPVRHRVQGAEELVRTLGVLQRGLVSCEYNERKEEQTRGGLISRLKSC